MPLYSGSAFILNQGDHARQADRGSDPRERIYDVMVDQGACSASVQGTVGVDFCFRITCPALLQD